VAVYALGTTVPQLFADPDAGIDLAMLVHAEQEFEWTRHPQIGETLLAQARIADDQTRRGLRLLTLETSCTAGGEPLCVSRMLSAIRLR
jgi:hypothetical protein